MYVLRHLIELLTAQSIDKSGLTDTVTTDETVLSTTCELDGSLVEQGLTTGNKSHVGQMNVGTRLILLVVLDLWGRNLGLGAHELMDLLVECVLFGNRPLIVLLVLLGEVLLAILGAVTNEVGVTIGLLTSEQGIVEVVLANDTRMALLHEIRNGNRSRQLLSDNSVTVAVDVQELFFEERLVH